MAMRPEHHLETKRTPIRFFPRGNMGKNLICMSCRREEGPFPLRSIRPWEYKEELYKRYPGRYLNDGQKWVVYTGFERYRPSKFRFFLVLYVDHCAYCLKREAEDDAHSEWEDDDSDDDEEVNELSELLVKIQSVKERISDLRHVEDLH